MDANLRLPLPLPHTVRSWALGLLLRHRRMAACRRHNQVCSAVGATGLDWSMVGGLSGRRREARVRHSSTLKEDEEADKLPEGSQKQRSILLKLARLSPPRSRPLSIRSTWRESSSLSSPARTQIVAKSSASHFSARFSSHSHLPQLSLKMNPSSSPLPHSLKRIPGASSACSQNAPPRTAAASCL